MFSAFQLTGAFAYLTEAEIITRRKYILTLIPQTNLPGGVRTEAPNWVFLFQIHSGMESLLDSAILPYLWGNQRPWITHKRRGGKGGMNGTLSANPVSFSLVCWYRSGDGSEHSVFTSRWTSVWRNKSVWSGASWAQPACRTWTCLFGTMKIFTVTWALVKWASQIIQIRVTEKTSVPREQEEMESECDLVYRSFCPVPMEDELLSWVETDLGMKAHGINVTAE